MVISVLYYIFLVILLTIWFVVISFLWLLTVPFDKKRRILSYTSFIHSAIFIYACPGWKVKIYGRENLEKGCVVVSNHQNYYDIPLLNMLKFNARWVAKRELLKMPFIGHALLVQGDILIRRGDPDSAKKMLAKGCALLKKGVSVAIFPEGTRSKTGKTGRFKEGAFLLAKKAGVAVQPVFIDGTDTAFDGWKLITPHTFTIKVLPAISAEKVQNTDVRTLTDMAYNMIKQEREKINE